MMEMWTIHHTLYIRQGPINFSLRKEYPYEGGNLLGLTWPTGAPVELAKPCVFKRIDCKRILSTNRLAAILPGGLCLIKLPWGSFSDS